MKNRPIFATFAVSRTGNRGAVSMLESALDYLTEEKDAFVHVFSVYPKEDRKIPSSSDVSIRNGTPANLLFRIIPLCILYRIFDLIKIQPDGEFWGEDMDALLESDVCLMMGGTTFSDAKVIKTLYNVICILPAIILGKTSMMYSQTLGPFNNWFNRMAAKYCLSKMSFIAPRGQSSYKAVKSLELDVPIKFFSDSAFSLQVSSNTKEIIRKKYKKKLAGKKVVGISINTIVEKKCRKLGIEHHQAWIDLITHLQERNYKIMLIPHSIRPKARSKHNNDLISTLEIISGLDKQDGVLLIDEFYDCKELREVVGLTDYYVASRFHSMISALSTIVPVVVFGWGFHKYKEVLSEFQLENYYYDAKYLSGHLLIESFNSLVHDEVKIKKKISEKLPTIIESSKRNHEIAWSLLEK